VVLRRLVPLAAVAALVAGCGSTATHSAASKPKQCPNVARSLAKLNADIASIRHAARTTPAESKQINAATDRFLHDVATAPIPNLTRNRMIDHAAGALQGSCVQCFQALEAERPIVSIHYGGAGTCK
jgi:hypothetical protein